ncbi:unnamed protein product [Linum tenue]|uniref:Uncharacterized protein n=1 Tax=Linum tenue TaxID=586396 RepID=A0AAV0HIF4_9ROSI|nr:unnamed protein product [Linum tenue]
MCPLRFILVFFSAALAGYFAWTTVNASTDAFAEADFSNDSTADAKKQQESNMFKVNCFVPFFFLQVIQNGFWVFVEMASGRYLWRNFREMKTQ